MVTNLCNYFLLIMLVLFFCFEDDFFLHSLLTFLVSEKYIYLNKEIQLL